MASQTPPGRPGNLTAEQEVKLKEMWSQLLDLFGVAHEAPSTNGTSTPTTDASSVKAPKKRRGLFGSKKEIPAEGDAPVDNDKHNQNSEYKAALASQSPAELREAFWSNVKMDNPDALLLRFLRARKWDVHAAIVMLVSTGHWRKKEVHIDEDIMTEGELGALVASQQDGAMTGDKKEGEDFMAQLRMGKSFLHGVDKEGRPLCHVRVKLHHGGEQTEKSLERFTVYLIETARLHLKPPVDTATVVFNMTDFSLSNMDYTPVKFMIKCFEANYPESLGSVLVYKSPWIFSSIWKIIRGWLDPVVASKVHFASDVKELEEWIPRSQILAELGGDEQWSYQYIEPSASENDQMKDTAGRQKVQSERDAMVKAHESATIRWMAGEYEANTQAERARLAGQLEENYWRLDPFVRARSLYDRMGVVGKGGKLDFYPKEGITPAVADAGVD